MSYAYQYLFADNTTIIECNKYPRWELLAAVGGLQEEENSPETEGDIELVRRLLRCPDSEIFVNYRGVNKGV